MFDVRREFKYYKPKYHENGIKLGGKGRDMNAPSTINLPKPGKSKDII
jgi:hypothetical protein